MKRSKPLRAEPDRSSLDAAKYRATREVIDRVESRLIEEEEREELEKPGQTVMRVLIGIMLIAWIVIMSWIAYRSLKKTEPRAELPRPISTRIASI